MGQGQYFFLTNDAGWHGRGMTKIPFALWNRSELSGFMLRRLVYAAIREQGLLKGLNVNVFPGKRISVTHGYGIVGWYLSITLPPSFDAARAMNTIGAHARAVGVLQRRDARDFPPEHP